MTWSSYLATFVGPLGTRPIWVFARSRREAAVAAWVSIATVEAQALRARS